MAQDVLVIELRVLAGSITDMVQRARASRTSYSLEQFLNSDRRAEKSGVYWLYPVQDYVRCFRALDVKDRDGLDELCKRHYAEVEVRDAAEGLLESEELFGEFVSEVDEEVKSAEDKLTVSNVLTVGSNLPKNLELLDADSNDLVTISTVLDRAPFTLFVFKRHYI